MTIAKALAALETHLLAIAPAISTAFENAAFLPVNGVPYQRVSHLLAKPDDLAYTNDVTQDMGVMQVSLMYPIGKGRGEALTRGAVIRNHFSAAPRQLTNGGVTIYITSTPHVSGGLVDGDRWVIPVSITWTILT